MNSLINVVLDKYSEYKRIRCRYRVDVISKLWVVIITLCFCTSHVAKSSSVDGILNNYIPLMLLGSFALVVAINRQFPKRLLITASNVLNVIYLECVELMLVALNMYLLAMMTVFFKDISVRTIIIGALIYLVSIHILDYFLLKKNILEAMPRIFTHTVVTLFYILGMGNILGYLYKTAITHTISNLMFLIIFGLLLVLGIGVYLVILKEITQKEENLVYGKLAWIVALMLSIVTSSNYGLMNTTVMVFVGVVVVIDILDNFFGSFRIKIKKFIEMRFM